MADGNVRTGECKILSSFLEWCKDSRIKLSNKIQVTDSSTSHRYGVIALQDIKCNETLVDIPRSVTLSPSQSSIAEKLEEFEKTHEEKLEETSGWIPLLISLMHEIKIKDSVWGSYLSLCPCKEEFNQPMFWSEKERNEELAGLSILWDVQRDLFNIEKEYQQFVVPFIEENKDIMSLETHTLDLYKHMVGFVMSYSFTDSVDGVTLMVPVADIFNHHSNNNAALSFEDKETLKMVSTKSIKKGEEIFNTFGKLGNSQLLHMYGFVEKSQNMYDTVEVPLGAIVDTLEAADNGKLVVLQAMLAYMRKMGIADEKEPLVFCSAGLKSGPDIYAVLRILHMEIKEFTGLLKDHIKWYQDSFFLCLLEHIQEPTSGDKGDKDGDKVIEIINDSDDDIIIVKEVKGNKKFTEPDQVKNEGVRQDEAKENDVIKSQIVESEDRGDVSITSQDMTPTTKQEEHGTISNTDKHQSIPLPERNRQIKDDNRPMNVEDLKNLDHESQKDPETQKNQENSKVDIPKKASPNLSGQKKIKARKRKHVQQALMCEDSEDEMEMADNKPLKKPNHAKVRKNLKDKKNHITENEGFKNNIPENEEELESEELKEDKDELYSSAKDEDHSEDPEDGSDDDDSETFLQLTYDQINSILPPSWKSTMQSVIASVLAAMKEDDSNVDQSNMSEHKFMAYQIRSGQIKILKLLEKSVAS